MSSPSLMRPTRRHFASLIAASVLVRPALALNNKAKLVVIGGGPAGATTARLLAEGGGDNVAVTLIEPSKRYYSCFFSNHYLGGVRDFETLGHGYESLAVQYGINVVQDWASSIDAAKRRVTLGSGAFVDYDRLVIAPGIDIKFNQIEGYGIDAEAVMPHAYKAGTQVQVLRSMLERMREGGSFIMTVPAMPYRCPPGPYERACMAAHLLRRINPRAKVLIIDAKEDFSKSALFREAWSKYYPGMIEWIGPKDHGGIVAVDPRSMEIRTANKTWKADVANIIPPQKAGEIARLAGVTQGDWCPVVPKTLQSVADPAIHVLGDAAIATAMPKSAFAANSQAHVAAGAILSAFSGTPLAEARFSNTCWSLLAPGDSVLVGGTYKASSKLFAVESTFISQVGEDATLRKKNFDDSQAWYELISNEVFG